MFFLKIDTKLFYLQQYLVALWISFVREMNLKGFYLLL